MKRSRLGLVVALPLLLVSRRTPAAEDLPGSLLSHEAASAGREDVATGGFETAAEREAADDTTELKVTGGGLFTGGNSESLAVTTSTRFRLRRGRHQLGAAVAANYGEAASEDVEERRTTVENAQGKVRYDRFVAERLSLFLAESALRDRFQGLALRLNVDPGVAHYFLVDPKHRFWGEFGYDLQYDFRSDAAVQGALVDGTVLARTKLVHAGRLFAGYENNLSETFAFDLGVEYLQSLTEQRRFRLAGSAGVTSRIAGNFSVATTFDLRYDHAPLPGVQATDYTSAVSLVYQLF